MSDKYENFTELIMTSYRAIYKIKEQNMKKINLKATDVNCIYYLSRYPDGLSNARLSELTGVDKAALSRRLSSLLESGYVELSDLDDPKKYGKRYVLTKSGRHLAESVNRKVDALVEEVGKHISEKESRAFYKTFNIISEELVRQSEERK